MFRFRRASSQGGRRNGTLAIAREIGALRRHLLCPGSIAHQPVPMICGKVRSPAGVARRIRSLDLFRSKNCFPVAEVSSQIASLEEDPVSAVASPHRAHSLVIGEPPGFQQIACADFARPALCIAVIACIAGLVAFVDATPCGTVLARDSKPLAEQAAHAECALPPAAPPSDLALFAVV